MYVDKKLMLWKMVSKVRNYVIQGYTDSLIYRSGYSTAIILAKPQKHVPESRDSDHGFHTCDAIHVYQQIPQFALLSTATSESYKFCSSNPLHT